jgi:hypothetical protein
MMNRAGLIVAAGVSLVGLSACHPPPPPEPVVTQRAVVEMAEADFLACAGPPPQRVTYGGERVFLCVQHAGARDRTCVGSKGIISDVRHGCEADITV